MKTTPAIIVLLLLTTSTVADEKKKKPVPEILAPTHANVSYGAGSGACPVRL